MKKAVLVVLVFIIMQVVVPIVTTYILGAYGMSFGGVDKVSGQICNPYVLSGMMLAIYALTIGALYSWRLLSPRAGIVRRRTVLPLAVAILVLALVPMSYVEELLDLSDSLGGSMESLMHNPLGIFCLAVAGPVVEELVFRRAFLGSLLEGKVKAVVAVPITALVFGLVHFNPAQIPAAFVIGILLGWLYVRTGSIIPSVVCHVVNNSLCVVVALCVSKNATFSLLVGGTVNAVAISVAAAVIAALLIRTYNRKTAASAEPAHEILHDEN